MPRNFRNILAAGAALIAAALPAGCIKNDIPYPKIPQMILSLAAEGEESAATIDAENYSATVWLDETVDIEAVRFTEFSCSPGAEVTPNPLEGTYNLSTPLIVTLSLYQSYQWRIEAVQNITRWFTVAGQVGETVIDAVGRRIIVRVPESQNLSHLEVTSVKLGPEGITTIVPDITAGEIDLSRPLRVSVTCHGREQIWTIYAEHTEQIVATAEVAAWSCVIWATGEAPADADNKVQYRRADSTEWIDVPKEDTTFGDGSFTARIAHLQPLTEYVVRAVSGTEVGNEVTVTTQATEVLPDGSFDQWWLDGKIWCPWDKNGQRFWDTGNTGAATLGQSNVYPTDQTPDGVGQAACLETRFVGIGVIGKLAAGSIYTGSFQKVDGTNGILDFGRPWTSRPTKLKGYYRYVTAPINYTSADLKYLEGRPDSCHIYVALTDWSAPYEIRTNPKTRQVFDSTADYVIAYGELVTGTTTDGYVPFEIELDYRSVSRNPSFIQVTCAASKYGDYFTGGTGATLYVDQFSLSYDY